MTCDQARRLLSLYRPGERTDEETRALEAHILSCPACKRLSKEFDTVPEKIRHVALQEPILGDPSGFTYEVMSRISPGLSHHARTWIDTLFLPAQRPAVRFVLVGVVFLALASFGVQTFDTLADMHGIEQRFSHQRAAGEHARVRYEIDLSGVRVTREQDLALHAAGLLPEPGSRLLVTDHLVQLLRSLIDRPTAFVKHMDLVGGGLDWNSVLYTLGASPKVRPTFLEND